MEKNKAVPIVLGAAAAGLFLTSKAKAAPSPGPSPSPQEQQVLTKEENVPTPGTCRVYVRVYGADGSLLRDYVIRVIQDNQVLAEVNMESYGSYDLALDMTPGTYVFQVIPDPSIDYYYMGKGETVTVDRDMSIIITLPLRNQ